MFNHVIKADVPLPIKADVPLRDPVSRVKALKEDNEQTRVLSYDEQQRYMAVASPKLRDVATLMLQTGMRRSRRCGCVNVEGQRWDLSIRGESRSHIPKTGALRQAQDRLWGTRRVCLSLHAR
jgi:hypothetical protein